MKSIFGGFLKKLRVDRKLTLRDVEQQASISNAYLSQVERGKRSIPTMKILCKLAKVYGVQVSILSEKAEAELENRKEKTNEEIPAPNTEFIYRGYANLSEGNKQTLNKFLQYLQNEEKNKNV